MSFLTVSRIIYDLLKLGIYELGGGVCMMCCHLLRSFTMTKFHPRSSHI